MDLSPRIKELTEKHYKKVLQIRRHIHANPELAFREFKTMEYIVSQLEDINLSYKPGIAGTGVVAWIEGRNDTPVIALRADIDALPINEENDVSYKSTVKNCMHACGHDVHTASLLGAAKILKELESEISGKILFVFQPGEEKLPGGAKMIIDTGVFDDHKPDIFIGQHVDPEMDAGIAGFKPGVFMASADEIYINIRGKGGHAAIPAQRTNNLLIASKLLVRLNDLVESYDNDGYPPILIFGKIIGEGATNVIPSEINIEGTFRAVNEEIREKIHDGILEIAESISKEEKVECIIEIKKGYPVLVNDDIITQKAINQAEQYLGASNVREVGVRMTAEDFAYYSQKYPSVFYRLGTGNKNSDIKARLHRPDFDIDEEALKTGMGLLAYLALTV